MDSRERRLFLAVLVTAGTLASTLFGDIDNRSLDLMRALERGRLSIDRDAANTYDKAFMPNPPRAASVALGDVAPASVLVGGHYYAGAAPGTAFLTFPVYLLARRALPARILEVALVAFAGAFMLALGAVGVRRAVLRGSACSEEQATVAALVHALGTIALPYATRLYAHAIVLCCCSWALALLLRRREHEGPPRAAAAGLVAGVAVLCDYNAVFPVFALGAVALVTGGWRSGLAFAFGGLPVAAVLATYQNACFGSPLGTPYDHHADPHIAWICAQGNRGFTYPRPWIVFELVAGLRRGWLWSQPAVFLGLAGLAAAVRGAGASAGGDSRSRRVALVALATAIATLLTSASRAADWDAGASFGARYTITALPFVALGYPRGIALAGRAAWPLLGASFALVLAGSASGWSFSVVEVLAQLLAFGPNLRGVARVLLGTGPRDVTAATALASAAALSLALGVAAWLLTAATEKDAKEGLTPRARRALVGAVVALPWLVSLPFATSAFWKGTAQAVAERRRDLGVLETRHVIRGATDAANARALVPVARSMSVALDAPDLYEQALQRVLELDPDDADARARLAELRHH